MNKYIAKLEALGMKVLEASVSTLLGFWFIRATDPDGYEYSWVVDPGKGPLVDPEDELPWEVFDAWELL